MSPAPVRTPRRSSESFPHAWGYWVGAALVLVGIVVAVVGIVSGITGFADDVRDLRRVLDGRDLEASLDGGDEVFVYDETDVGLGPFEVTVIRTSDGAEVATDSLIDGTSYDIDGRRGEARAAFRVPTSDIYRIEVSSSVGDFTRFAIGGDVGNNRTDAITAGLLWGGILAFIGFVVFVWTLMLHARWKVRDAVLDQVASARAAVRDRTQPAMDPEGRREAASEGAQRATSWTRDRLDQARAKLPGQHGDHGRPPTWRESLADQARDRLDQVEEQLSTIEPAAGDAAGQAEFPADLIGRVDDTLGRIESRVAAGEPLRDIARDERVLAEEAAKEIADQAREAQVTAAEELAAVEQDLRHRASTELEGLGTELSEIGATALDDAASQLGDAGDDLATGIAATAGAAAAAGAAEARQRGRDVFGFEIDETDLAGEPLPDPPTADALSSSLPAPPISSLPTPPDTQLSPPPPPPAPPTPATDIEPEEAAELFQMSEESDEPEAAELSEMSEEPDEAELAPSDLVAQPSSTPSAPQDRLTVVPPRHAAPDSESILAPPPAAVRALADVRGSVASEAVAETVQPNLSSPPDSFSALAPPPPAARPLSSPQLPEPEISSGTAELEEDQGESAAVDSDPETGDRARPTPEKFVPAPAPDYSSLVHD